MDAITGTAGNDTIIAPATSPTTGANATTINSGDTIVGGAGDDTLNITISSTNNNSLTGLTVSGVETVNISGTNNLGTSSPALAAAQDAKAVTAAALAARQAEATLAVSNDAAADVVATLAGLGITAGPVSNGQSEFAVVQASTATLASAAARVSAGIHYETLTATAKTNFATAQSTYLAMAAVAALADNAAVTAAATATTGVAGVTAGSFTIQQYNAAAVSAVTKAGAVTAAATLLTSAATAADTLTALVNTLAASATADATYSMPTAATGQTRPFAVSDVRYLAGQYKTSATGTDLTVNDATSAGKIAAANAVLAREAIVDGALAAVNNAVQSTETTDIVADQEAAAAAYIATLTDAQIRTLAAADSTALGTAFTALNRTDFTSAQLGAAAKAAGFQFSGAAVVTDGESERAAEISTAKAAVAAVNTDFSLAQLNAAAVNATRDATGVSIITAGDDSVAIKARADARATATETARTTALTAADAALQADVNAANNVTVAQSGVAATSVAATQFADATQIWLSGSSSKTNVTGVAATQTIGFSSVSSMDNSVTFGSTVAAGSLAVSGSTGTVTVTGAAMATLNISGTGSTALTLVDNGQAVSATGADTIKTLNLSTSGSTALTTSGLTELTTVSQTGAGAVTANLAAKVASVTTGAGADLLKVITATAADNPGTTVDETVNASVSSGAGNDRLIIATTGSGRTAVDAGAGNDTIFLTANSNGSTTIASGDGDDTLRVGAISTLQATKIDGGSGTDTLVTSTTTFTATDYTILGANVSGVENLSLTGRVVALDASKTGFTTFTVLGKDLTTVNTITEISSAQNVVMARTASVTATTGFDETGITGATPSHLSVSSKGYLVDSDVVASGNQTVWGDDLRVTLTHTDASTSLLANGNKLTLGVTALARSGVNGSTTGDVAGISTTATLTGDVRSAEVTLTSVRGTGSATAPYGLGNEQLAGFTMSVNATNLQNMTSVKVSGAGAVSINAGTLAALPTALAPANAKLTLIDLSGMTAFANQNSLGQEVASGPTSDTGTAGGFFNLSTSEVTLNANISQTVILGGARDTIVLGATGSQLAARDTITGFQVTASTLNPLLVDTARSDVLKIGTNFNSSATLGTADFAAKFAPTGSSLDAALLEAANLKSGATNIQNVVFNFGGNTYVYVDRGTEGLTDDDQLVVLSGSLNLDLLIQSGVIIA